jgi:hypothetical protein
VQDEGGSGSAGGAGTRGRRTTKREAACSGRDGSECKKADESSKRQPGPKLSDGKEGWVVAVVVAAVSILVRACQASPINCPVTPFVAREQRRASRNRDNKTARLLLYCTRGDIVKLELQEERLCRHFPHNFGSLLASKQAVFELPETNKLLLLPAIVCRYTAARKSLSRLTGTCHGRRCGENYARAPRVCGSAPRHGARWWIESGPDSPVRYQLPNLFVLSFDFQRLWSRALRRCSIISGAALRVGLSVISNSSFPSDTLY